jgi:cell division protein FtsL
MNRTYQLLRRAVGPAPNARDAIITMIVLAALVTAIAIAQVARRREVIRVGYQLSRETQRLEAARERRQELEVERATLIQPDRLRELAERLGMEPVEPIQLRVVAP